MRPSGNPAHARRGLPFASLLMTAEQPQETRSASGVVLCCGRCCFGSGVREVWSAGPRTWLHRLDLNQRPSGYEPAELPTALRCRNAKSRRANHAAFKNRGRVLLSRSSHVATGDARLLRGDVQRRVAGREGQRPLQSTVAILIAPHCGVQALSDRVARDAHRVIHEVRQPAPRLPVRNP